MAMIGWLVVFVALVGIEVGTMALTTIWFAGGALAAFFMALAGLSFQVQMTVFLAVSFVLLIFTRPFAVKYVNKGTVRTNVDGLVGKKARVLEEIDNGSGFRFRNKFDRYRQMLFYYFIYPAFYFCHHFSGRRFR